jgi:hypothetical protein
MALTGSLTDYIQASILYNVAYADNGVLNRVYTIFFGVLVLNLLFVYAVLGVRFVFRHYPAVSPIQRQFFFFVCIGLVIDIILQSLSGRLYLHYYSPWLPYLCFLGALGLLKIDQTRLGTAFKGIRVVVILLLAGQFLFYSVYQLQKNFNPQTRSDYQSALQVVQTIRDESSSSDTIVVWGSESYIYTLSGRSAPTRFFYQYPLIANTRNDIPWTQEFLQQLKTAKPRFIVESDSNPEFPPMDKVKAAAWGTLNRRTINPVFYDVVDTIRQNYQEIRTLGTWHIYQIR